jgi:hypothetical protein
MDSMTQVFRYMLSMYLMHSYKEDQMIPPKAHSDEPDSACEPQFVQISYVVSDDWIVVNGEFIRMLK